LKPVGRGKRSKIIEGPVLRPFSYECSFGFFKSTSWLVPSAGQKIPVQPDWYLPRWKIPLDESRFLHACKGCTKYKGKNWAVFYVTQNINLPKVSPTRRSAQPFFVHRHSGIRKDFNLPICHFKMGSQTYLTLASTLGLEMKGHNYIIGE
jgi:hypothetical protein